MNGKEKEWKEEKSECWRRRRKSEMGDGIILILEPEIVLIVVGFLEEKGTWLFSLPGRDKVVSV